MSQCKFVSVSIGHLYLICCSEIIPQSVLPMLPHSRAVTPYTLCSAGVIMCTAPDLTLHKNNVIMYIKAGLPLFQNLMQRFDSYFN